MRKNTSEFLDICGTYYIFKLSKEKRKRVEIQRYWRIYDVVD